MTTKEIQDRADAAKHAPISLPAGSYNVEDLHKIGEAAVKAKPEDRDELVAKRLDEVNATSTARQENGLEPGMKFVEVTREDLGVTERIQVRAKPAGETEEETAEIDRKAIDKQIADANQPGAAAADKE